MRCAVIGNNNSCAITARELWKYIRNCHYLEQAGKDEDDLSV